MVWQLYIGACGTRMVYEEVEPRIKNEQSRVSGTLKVEPERKGEERNLEGGTLRE